MAISGSSTISDAATGHAYRGVISRAFATNEQEGKIVFTSGTPGTETSIVLTTTTPSMVFIRNRVTTGTPDGILRVGIVTSVYDLALFPGEGIPWPLNNVQPSPVAITLFFTGSDATQEFEYQVWPQKV